MSSELTTEVTVLLVILLLCGTTCHVSDTWLDAVKQKAEKCECK